MRRCWTAFTLLLSLERTPERDLWLGALLAFVAGGINAGGFLAVGQYTSHMTGIVSHVADELLLLHWRSVAVGMLGVLFFVLGCMFSAWCIHWALRHRFKGAYGLPFVFQAGSMIIFGLFGAAIGEAGHLLVPLTVLQLCYLMGLQNAAYGQISLNNARSTHITGMVTDLGVELGRLTYYNRARNKAKVRINRARFNAQVLTLVTFFTGAVLGSWGFNTVGYITTVPFAGLLVLMSTLALRADIRKIRALLRMARMAYTHHRHTRQRRYAGADDAA